MTEPPLHRCASLDLADDSGVVADAGVKAEVSAVDMTEPDRTDVARGDPVCQQLHRRDRIVGHTQCAGEHVGAAAGKDRQRGVGSGDAGSHFVQRAVAAEADDDIDAAPGSVVWLSLAISSKRSSSSLPMDRVSFMNTSCEA